MQAKKNPKADLERKRGLFIQIGYVITLALIFLAFEWKSYEEQNFNLGQLQVENVEEVIIPITEQELKPPPPPPPPVQELNIVENTEELKEELEAQSTEVTEETQIVAVEQKEEVVEEDVVFQIVEDMPKFGKGDADLLNFLTQNIRYPQVAKELGISGIVYVTFVVDKNGTVKESKILRGIGGNCDEEALRVVQSMPKWSPGKQRGKPVSVQFNLPVRFVLK